MRYTIWQRSETFQRVPQADRLPQEKCLREEQKDCIKICSMKDSFAISPPFLKESNLWTLSTSNVSDEWSCLDDHGGLSSSRSHNERLSWTVEHNRSHSNGSGYRLRSREELESARLCVNICKYGSWHPCICRLVLTFCIAKCVLKSPSVGFQFEGQSLKYSVSMFRKKVDNWKPQAGDHVTGLCRRSISGRNDLLL